ncbi:MULTISPECIES: glycoside hydrolase domain-containing protein [unclassified Nocardioides]|uniref:glycoside hydrolase domain-containing protein n=1 Tax=unclassified Nocardioides TaxID=2615069 RepID=UPI000056FB1C|nr:MULTISPECIES: glycoside hydrolase domain-containing protein [unclassified Nocardioides]ABL83827.1 Peptidoglycan-binding domain 1 protein [Nocardioides sp. JS614]
MSRPHLRTPRTLLRRALVTATGGLLAVTTVAALGTGGPADAAGTAPTATSTTTSTTTSTAAKPAAKRAANPVTPGDFTGFGFDQCHTPEQRKMNRWLQSSPFLAVGIYISGDSRACREQPELTPTWVRTQLAKGWRLLPITLGPQASCQPRFPRYGDDETIIPRPGANGGYSKAKKQGNAEAVKSVGVAADLGIAPGSTLWYDLEGFDLRNTRCRESALAFLSGWTWQIHRLGYASGVYSGASSGIKMLDDARVNRPGQVVLPDQIWLARWDGKANTSSSYLREDGWRPHARIKQYQGGHDETWGGVTINIDRNFLDVGRGMVAPSETHCGGVRVNFRNYETLRPPTETTTPGPGQVSALQCLLTEQEFYGGAINGRWTKATVKAIQAWQAGHDMAQREVWSRKNWMSLLSAGETPVLKLGSTGLAVRRLQRTLNAAGVSDSVRMNGMFKAETADAVRAYQQQVGTEVSGVAGYRTWRALSAGRL